MGLVSFIQRWKARHLAASWVAYWVALIAVKLGPALAIAWRMRKGSGTISANFSNSVIDLTMTELGRSLYSANASLTEVVAWVALPPLMLTVAWLLLRPRRSSGSAPAAEIGSGMPEGIGDPDWRAAANAEKPDVIDR